MVTRLLNQADELLKTKRDWAFHLQRAGLWRRILMIAKPEALYEILRTLRAPDSIDEMALSVDEMCGVMSAVAHLDVTQAKLIRRIKKLAIANGKKRWVSLVKMPFTPKLDVIVSTLSAQEVIHRKRTLQELTRGDYKAKRARIADLNT